MVDPVEGLWVKVFTFYRLIDLVVVASMSSVVDLVGLRVKVFFYRHNDLVVEALTSSVGDLVEGLRGRSSSTALTTWW